MSFDISWDEVAKYAVASPESIARVATMLNRYPDRFLFGTDTVAPSGPGPYFAVFDMWAPVWQAVDARGQPQGAQGQLRAVVRRRSSAGPRVGKGQRRKDR